MANRFNFTGTFSVDEEKYLTTGKTKKGADYASLRCSVAQNKSNRAFLEMFGQYEKEINTYNNDGDKISIVWANRFDADVVKVVRQKYVLALSQTDRYEFISKYDFINAVKEHIAELKGKVVTITGQIQKNLYNGKWSDRFTINNIYVVPDDSKAKLVCTYEFFYNKESLDAQDFKDEKKAYFNGYVQEWVDGANKYVPHQVLINANKVNFEEEKQTSKLDFMLMTMKAKRDGLKITSDAKNTNYFKISLECNYTNGSEEIPWDESCLTDYQKLAVASGTTTLDALRPRGQIYGERVVTFNVTGFDLREEYADGPVEVDKASAFEEEVYSGPNNNQTLDDLDKAMNPPEEKKSEKEEDWDLFS